MANIILKNSNFTFGETKEIPNEIIIIGMGYNSGGTNDNTSTLSAANRAILMLKVSDSNPKCATKVRAIAGAVYTALYIPQNAKVFKAHVNDPYQCVATVFDGTSYSQKVFDTVWNREVAIDVSTFGGKWITLSVRNSDNSAFAQTVEAKDFGLQYFFI